MSNILLSDLYTAHQNGADFMSARFGQTFYAAEVGFGKIEEVELEDGTPATAVSFADVESEPFVNPGVTEVECEILPPQDNKLTICAIELAIKHREQARLFV